MSELTPKKAKKQAEKLKKATDIASRGQRVTKNYQNFERSILKFFHFISGLIDRVLFGQKFAFVSSLLLAVVLVFALNLTDTRLLSQYKSVETIAAFKVSVNANTEVYEVTGIPETVSIQIIGDLPDLQMNQSTNDMSVVADLSALSEGTYQIPLRAVNHSPRLQVKIDPSTVMVSIARKVSKQFFIGWEFINLEKADAIYDFANPILASNQTIVRAAQSTLDSIASVKALIDVTGMSSSFIQDAKLVAYDQQGNRIIVDIIPQTVAVEVTVTAPNKTVPVVIQPVGEIPNGMSIASITLDYQSITLYATNSVLEQIESVVIPVDVTKVVGDTESAASVVLPSGVKKSNITRVHFSMKLGATETKTLSGIKVFANNLDQSKFRFSLMNASDAYVDVIVSGTKENIAKVTAEQIQANVDFSTIIKGRQSLAIVVSGPNALVRYAPAKSRLEIDVVGT